MPYLLAVTDMLIHDLDTPQIFHGNSLGRKVTEFTENDKFSVIVMDPPYGGNEQESIRDNFPADLQCNETADLFIALILYRLKYNGRAAVIIHDGFLLALTLPEKTFAYSIQFAYRYQTSRRCFLAVYYNYDKYFIFQQ